MCIRDSYYIVPKKAQWCILLLASAAFYMAGSVKAFAWVVLVAGMTWVTGLIRGRYNACLLYTSRFV